MIIALDVIPSLTARMSLVIDEIVIDILVIITSIAPRALPNQFKWTALQGPVDSQNGERPCASRVVVSPEAGSADLDTQDGTKSQASYERQAVVIVETCTIRSRRPVPICVRDVGARCGARPPLRITIGRTAIGIRESSRDVGLVVQLGEPGGVKRAVGADARLMERSGNDPLVNDGPFHEVSQRRVMQEVELAEGKEKNSRSKVQGVIDEVVNCGKFHFYVRTAAR